MSRLPRRSGLIGAPRNNRRKAESNATLPVVPEARQKAQQPAARNQERYHTAGRRQTCRCEVSRPSRWSGLIGLLRNNRRNQLLHVTGAATTARRAPAKRDRSVLKSTFGNIAQVAGNGDQFGKQFNVNDTGLSGTFTVFHPLDMIFFGF